MKRALDNDGRASEIVVEENILMQNFSNMPIMDAIVQMPTLAEALWRKLTLETVIALLACVLLIAFLLYAVTKAIANKLKKNRSKRTVRKPLSAEKCALVLE